MNSWGTRKTPLGKPQKKVFFGGMRGGLRSLPLRKNYFKLYLSFFKTKKRTFPFATKLEGGGVRPLKNYFFCGFPFLNRNVQQSFITPKLRSMVYLWGGFTGFYSCTLCSYHVSLCISTMVLILDGNSENNAHVCLDKQQSQIWNLFLYRF